MVMKKIIMFHPTGGLGGGDKKIIEIYWHQWIMGVTTDNAVISPVCEATQNSERFESNTQVLASVYRTAGPRISR